MAEQTRERSIAVREVETKLIRGEYSSAAETAIKNELTRNEFRPMSKRAARVFERTRVELRRSLQKPSSTSSEPEPTSTVKEPIVRIRSPYDLRYGRSGVDMCASGTDNGKTLYIVPGENTRKLMDHISMLLHNVDMISTGQRNVELIRESCELVRTIRKEFQSFPADEGTPNNRELIKNLIAKSGPMMDLILLMELVQDGAVKTEGNDDTFTWAKFKSEMAKTRGLRLKAKRYLITSLADRLDPMIASGWFDGTPSIVMKGNYNEEANKFFKACRNSDLFAGEHLFSKSPLGFEKHSRYLRGISEWLITGIDDIKERSAVNELRVTMAQDLYVKAEGARLASLRHHDRRFLRREERERTD